MPPLPHAQDIFIFSPQLCRFSPTIAAHGELNTAQKCKARHGMRKNASYSPLILAFLAATTLITAGCYHRGWGHGAGFHYGSSSPGVYYTPKTYYSTHHTHTTTVVRPGPIVHHPAPPPSHAVKPAPAPKPEHVGKPNKHPGNHQTNLNRPGNQASRPTPPTHVERPSGRPQPSFAPGKHRDSSENPTPGKRREKKGM